MSARMTRQQQQALSTLGCNYGEASELTLWQDGLSRPRLTMLSLERRGLVKRGEFVNEDYGYMWSLPHPLPLAPSWRSLGRAI